MLTVNMKSYALYQVATLRMNLSDPSHPKSSLQFQRSGYSFLHAFRTAEASLQILYTGIGHIGVKY